MVINFIVNPVAGGWDPGDNFLAGTEDSVVKWAEGLAGKKHKVTVFRNSGRGFKDLTYKGVLYRDRSSYSGGADVCINVKSYDVPKLEPTFYLTNETDASRHDLSIYEGVIWPSKWAVDNIPTNARQVFILPYGYDPKTIYPAKKKRYQCLYASSPDRGLGTLLNIWPEIHKKHPDSQLLVTYGAEIPPTTGVKNLGKISEQSMNRLYRTSEFWCHPCNGGELYCITGIKAQAAGCIPVIIPRMALAETVNGGFWARDESSYLAALDAALSSSSRTINSMRKDLSSRHYPTWEDSVEQLEDIMAAAI